MAVDTFIFRGEWIDNIEKMPVETQDKILAEMVRYGTRRSLQYQDDPVIFSLVNMIKGSVDASISDYEKKVEMSQTAGRKKRIDDKKIRELALQGKTSQEIADILQCSKSSIDKSEGWKNRKKEESFVF